MGESHEMLRGPRPPTLNTWQRGTLSAGWLLCDKSPFVLAGERISSLQLLHLKSAGPSARALGRPGNRHNFSCISADNRTLFHDPPSCLPEKRIVSVHKRGHMGQVSNGNSSSGHAT